jgi:PAS domain-containing protein
LFAEGHVDLEYRFLVKGGGYRWLRAELRLLRDEAGKPVEAVGSWSDVSERKQAELKLQESEEQYRLLFDSNPHPMWVYDQETFAFLAVNDAALRHYGYSRDEWLAMTALDIRPPEEVSAFKEEYRAGIVGAAMLMRLLSSLLFDVSALDPIAFATAGAALFGVGVAAAFVPALRAGLADPLKALREQ